LCKLALLDYITTSLYITMHVRNDMNKITTKFRGGWP